MSEKQWYKVARKIIKAGGIPVPINATLIEILKTLITEKHLKFLQIFSKSSLTLEQIKGKSDFDEESLNKILNELMHIGLITAIPSRSTGILIYRLVPFLPGLLEMTLMRGERGAKQKKLAELWEKLFNDMSHVTQKNYDIVMAAYKNAPAIDRVVPVEEEIEVQEEIVLPQEEIKKIVEKFDIIGVSYCYCRHKKDLLGDPCKINAPRQNCLSFGRTAQYIIEHDFAKQISKEEALRILKEAEDLGLVHKAFHVRGNPELEEIAICNCCKCCCGNFGNYYRGASPISTITSYISKVNEDECVGCGTCVEACPLEIIDLISDIAVINEQKCIGCGVCAHLCPQNAIKFERTGLRRVFIPAPIVTSN